MNDITGASCELSPFLSLPDHLILFCANFLSINDVFGLRLVDKRVFKISIERLEMFSKGFRNYGIPSQSVFDRLTDWEGNMKIMLPEDIKYFYASWNRREQLHQKCMTVHNRGCTNCYRIREIRMISDIELHSDLSSDEFICIAISDIVNVHKDIITTLITFLDINGYVGGIPNSIIEYEHSAWDSEGIEIFTAEDLKRLLDERPYGAEKYVGHGYRADGLGMIAGSFFEMLEMMPENRFFHFSEPSTLPVMWERCSGRKCFVARVGGGLVLSEEERAQLQLLADSDAFDD